MEEMLTLCRKIERIIIFENLASLLDVNDDVSDDTYRLEFQTKER